MSESVKRRTRFRRAFAGLIGLTMMLGMGACSSGENGDKTLYSGDLAVTDYTGFIDMLPIVVAFENGYFKDAGLDLHMTSFGSGADVMRAMASGAQLGAAGIFTSLGAYASGMDSIRMVGSLQHKNALVFMTDADSPITSVAELKGHTLGVTGGTSSTDYAASEMLKSAGLSKDDVSLVNVKSAADSLTALENGVIDSGWGLPPLATQAKMKGRARVLWDAASNLPPQTNSGLFARADFAKEHSDVVHAYVDAVRRAIDAIHADPAAAAKIYAKASGVELDVANAAVQALAPGFAIGLDRKGIENNIQGGHEVGLYDPDSVTYDNFVDPQFAGVK